MPDLQLQVAKEFSKEKSMIETKLDEATFSDEKTRQRIIQELVSKPNETIDEVRKILQTNAKRWWRVAVQVIRAIGYPRNAVAIPELIEQISDKNSPAWEEAVQTLVEMGAEAVVPSLIQAMVDEGQTNKHWVPAMEDMCAMLSYVDQEFADLCSPVIIFLLGQHDLPESLDLSLLLNVLETIDTARIGYAIPTLIDLVKREGISQIGKQTRTLIASFSQRALDPYRLLLPA
jgi:hypothetical protein